MYHNGKIIGLDGEEIPEQMFRRLEQRGLAARVYRHQSVTPELGNAIAETLRSKFKVSMGGDVQTLGIPRAKRLLYDFFGLTGVKTQKGFDKNTAVCSAGIAEAFRKHKLNILPGNRPATDVNVTLPNDLANDKVRFVGTFGKTDYAKQKEHLKMQEKILALAKAKAALRISNKPISKAQHAMLMAKSPAAKMVGLGLAGVGSTLGLRSLLGEKTQNE